VPVFRKAVELRPDLTTPRYQLGSALFETGDFAEAAVQFEGRWAVFQNGGSALLLALPMLEWVAWPDAIKEYEKGNETPAEPLWSASSLGRGPRPYGKSEAACRNLAKAATLQPESPEPHGFSPTPTSARPGARCRAKRSDGTRSAGTGSN